MEGRGRGTGRARGGEEENVYEDLYHRLFNQCSELKSGRADNTTLLFLHC